MGVDEIIDILEKKGEIRLNELEYEALIKLDLQCDGLKFKNMPSLRRYLEERFEE